MPHHAMHSRWPEPQRRYSAAALRAALWWPDAQRCPCSAAAVQAASRRCFLQAALYQRHTYRALSPPPFVAPSFGPLPRTDQSAELCFGARRKRLPPRPESLPPQNNDPSFPHPLHPLLLLLVACLLFTTRSRWTNNTTCVPCSRLATAPLPARQPTLLPAIQRQSGCPFDSAQT